MDINNYIGIPFVSKGRTLEGFDCWGLIMFYYFEEFNILLEGYENKYETVKDKENISEAFEEHTEDAFIKVDAPKNGDVVLLRMKGIPIHVGIYLEAEDRMLHVYNGIDTVAEKLNNSNWRERIAGYYRHIDRI